MTAISALSPAPLTETSPSWIARLPRVRGRYIFPAPMADYTWFQVGGPADVLFKPEDQTDLQDFLINRPPEIPLYILGAGSNVLVRDGGLRGIVIKLGRGFNEIIFQDNYVIAGGGALDRTVALTCAQNGLGGLEFLVGIPGTIGGAIKINAGCYSTETKDVLEWVDIMDFQGTVKRLTMSELAMSYRHSALQDNQIVLRACLRGIPQESSIVLRKIDQLLKEREASQPVKGRTGGSTFKNLSFSVKVEDLEYSKAWQLIDLAGCRGLQVGGAQVSTKHCNFLINIGKARACDLEALGEMVRESVRQKAGIDLQWEIVRLGEKEK